MTDNTQKSHAKAASQVADMLLRVLADTYVLYTKTQNFHWNVEDSRFYSLHLLFEKQYEELAVAADLIAEHIRTLKVFVPATLKSFLSLSEVQEPEEFTDGDVMLVELYRDHQAVAARMRQGIELADAQGDAATSDLLVERVRAHDKMAWMLGSHFLTKSTV